MATMNIIGNRELINIRDKLIETVKELDKLIQLQEENLNIKENRVKSDREKFREMFLEDRLNTNE